MPTPSSQYEYYLPTADGYQVSRLPANAEELVQCIMNDILPTYDQNFPEITFLQGLERLARETDHQATGELEDNLYAQSWNRYTAHRTWLHITQQGQDFGTRLRLAPAAGTNDGHVSLHLAGRASKGVLLEPKSFISVAKYLFRTEVDMDVYSASIVEWGLALAAHSAVATSQARTGPGPLSVSGTLHNLFRR